jgi:hypothetical protein
MCVCEGITFPQVWVCNNFFKKFHVQNFKLFWNFEFFSQIQWFFLIIKNWKNLIFCQINNMVQVGSQKCIGLILFLFSFHIILR